MQSPTWLPKLRMSHLASACAAALALTNPVISTAQVVAPAPAAEGMQHFAIEAGPLAQVLPRFAAQAGVQLSADAQLTQGLHSAGVQGPHSVASGFAQLLQGTALEVVQQVNGIYVLQGIPAPRSNASAMGNTLPEVVVSAQASPRTENSGAYGGTAITAFKGTQDLRHTPQPVTVVSRQQMEEQAMTNLQDVLTTAAPGVTINYVDSERISFYARGHQIDSMQVDGLSDYQAGISGIQTDTAVLDRVEVIRGANGLMRGAGNPSATVNVVRKMPTHAFQSQVAAIVGSRDKRRGEFDISGPLNAAGTVRGRFVAAGENKNLMQTVRHDNRRVLYGVLQADLAPETELTAGWQYSRMNATGALGSLPTHPDGSQLGLPRQTYIGASWSQADRDKHETFFDLKHALRNGWDLKLMGSWSQTGLKSYRQSYFTPNPSNPYAGEMTASVYGGMAVTQGNLGFTANGPFELAGRKHELVLGTDLQRVRDNGFGYGWSSQITVDVDDIRTLDPYNDIPMPVISGEPTRYAPSYTRQRGAFATARLSLTDPLTAIVGARVSWWNYQVPATPSRNYAVNREVTPYLGLVYDVSQDWSLYAAYTEIFKPQQAFNAAGNIIAPVRGENYETGIKGDLMDGRLQASLSVFRINNIGKAVDDTATPDPCLPSYTTGYCKMAGGKTRSQGWEAELQGQITPRWNLSGSYTNTSTKYLRDSTASNVGKPLRSLDPKHILRLYSSYRFDGALSGLTLGGGVQAQSDKYATTRGVTYRQGGLALYSAMAKYAFNKDWSMQLNVNNLFDKVYYMQVGSGINNYYGDSRSWQLSLNARF
ncbi:TonB-dependent siderophore receptor [Lampropedia puyangensis]|uniref:TonB-dependent siderophore receptor n=2 Tax=Lampropedia puyangensis TaxID=1330072 RepID=A0A4S8F645_9BURK|nr:TonB-dependent siderophore receptor [Lampropedia puyangensis]